MRCVMDRRFTLALVISLAIAITGLAQNTGNRFSNDLPATGVPQPAAAPFSNDAPDNAPVTQNRFNNTGGTETANALPSTTAAATANEATPTVDSTATAKKSIGFAGARSFLSVLRNAGMMAIPIACCSLLLVMFVLERTISLRRRRVIPKHFVKLFLSELEEGQLKPGEALEQCEENNSPISEVFAAAVKKWNRPAVEVEQAVIDAGERVANGLRRYLRLFNGIATISPLLGLLGTVLGMITAFNAIATSADAMGKPEVLAEGIGQALLTTAGGLSVAIPAFIAYMYFSSRVDRLIIEIDGLGQQAVSAIASDAWKGKKTRKAA